MSRRTRSIVMLLFIASALSMAAVSYAWFVSVRATPPGRVSSALVRCLPEEGARDLPSLATYSSLISGSSIDSEGVPLILPGDRLISGVATAVSGGTTTRTIRASRARAFESGETAGTVIHSAVRYYLSDGVTSTVTRIQRDLMAVTNLEQWYRDGALLPAAPSPLPGAAYSVVISTATDETVAGAVTTTRTIITTDYTPLDSSKPTYRHVYTIVTTVTREAPSFQPAEGSTLWAGNTHLKTRGITVAENVLAIPAVAPALGGNLTRTYLIMTDTRPTQAGDVSSPPGKSTSLPLHLGNLSTVDTNIRIGLSAVLVPTTGAAEALTIRRPSTNSSTYYLGKTSGSDFIELLGFTPATRSGAGGYHWAPVPTDPTSSRALWDLTFNDASTTVPPVPIPAEGAPPAEPVLYAAVDDFYIVLYSSFGVDLTVFETAFNALYCSGSPTIQLRLEYYIRQNEFMDWSQFYAQNFKMALADSGGKELAQ